MDYFRILVYFFLVGNHRVHCSLGVHAAATTASRVRLPSGRLATGSRNGLRQGVLRLAFGGIGQGNLLVQQPFNSSDQVRIYFALMFHFTVARRRSHPGGFHHLRPNGSLLPNA